MEKSYFIFIWIKFTQCGHTIKCEQYQHIKEGFNHNLYIYTKHTTFISEFGNCKTYQSILIIHSNESLRKIKINKYLSTYLQLMNTYNWDTSTIKQYQEHFYVHIKSRHDIQTADFPYTAITYITFHIMKVENFLTKVISMRENNNTK